MLTQAGSSPLAGKTQIIELDEQGIELIGRLLRAHVKLAIVSPLERDKARKALDALSEQTNLVKRYRNAF